MCLIISSSVYPAIMSSVENKEAQIISKVMGELQQNDNVASGRYQAHLGMIDTSDFIPSSPTPADPILSATFSDNDETSGDNTSPTIQQQKDDGIDILSINSGKAVHTVWTDTTSEDIFYKRDGADFDPTTINLSKSTGDSANAAIAVLGNNVL
jgi:hypothetical protein